MLNGILEKVHLALEMLKNNLVPGFQQTIYLLQQPPLFRTEVISCQLAYAALRSAALLI